ncbi:DUF1559 domain-containing protein [Lignipirellula cremea]|uniref:DUF1559 domain-containing protein n=1 Tax=Lignipirellula cremea TaxID=2528010 RepID=A0A518E482_9BACT|nr:DUF1559 domain-containing protein [Lignipirellula cremea]QDU98901.1 hypothetical protein Pla8534_68120 [Lignipirellula cremea]
MTSTLLRASQRGTRHAFTLVELLAVIAIVAILLALLLPAVQMAREASRRSRCGNKQKQIVLAAHFFESAHKTIVFNRYSDPGYGGFSDWDAWGSYGGADSKAWSWLAALLPYLEQGNVYDQGSIPNSTFGESSATAQTVSVFFCPSDQMQGHSPMVEHSHYMKDTPAGLTNYKGVLGSNFCWGPYANTGASGECEPWLSGNGLLVPMAWRRPITQGDVEDGHSNTLMVGEQTWNNQVFGCSTCYGLGFAYAHSIEASANAALPPNAKRPDGTEFAKADFEGQNGFRSQHPGGVQFGFADGSVHFLSDSINLSVYRALATIADGEDVNSR